MPTPLQTFQVPLLVALHDEEDISDPVFVFRLRNRATSQAFFNCLSSAKRNQLSSPIS